MKINIYSIQKKSNDSYDKIIVDFIKMSKKFAIVEDIRVFNNQIAKAQSSDNEQEAKHSYTLAYEPYLKNGFNIALDVKGKQLDSFLLAQTLTTQANFNFFIGGAYGFSKEFLQKCDLTISLSNLTFAHKIAHIVLFEQIFRALSINHNHPYHKN
ncbi:MAG: 23S rRNA (pseudouridine(1915)-N(3))-methyltransferase RlmH [Arcobacter butzleri]|jgi:23S rRNA (pseudouridine1915-N3)-methyltransferase|nr:23S rRNA (pseudouridine(1915)-N(3))-methyltransferase RlmH [Arcobacteraceae bacterium]MDY0364988.1 23S rRNA (pseudouridine(1915)-N(3))-methyltransferase RlmH [Arcobacteraceae bacterium]NLO16931.1 23S rRNA (pseudouridine(1915)-N(3))-methyltransferase RlmH [Aliarcobacter butzleri]